MRILFTLCLLFMVGCEPVQVSTTGTSTVKKKANSKPAVKKPAAPAVAADAYDNIAQAIDVVALAAESGQTDERLKATTWLAMQGSAAVDPVAAALKDESTGDRAAIGLCRVLGQISTTEAADALIANLPSDREMIRLNAVDQLGMIEPTNPKIVSALSGVLDGEDQRMRQKALKALAAIGPPAKEVVPKVVAILNSRQDDTLRTDAKNALKRIDPRRGLQDVK